MEERIAPREVLLEAFPGIEAAQADEIVASGQVLDFPADRVLCNEDEPGFTFFIILSGQVHITKRFKSEQQRVLQVLGPGGFFGEMAILHNTVRAATVTTAVPTTVLQIHKDAFTGMIERNNSVSLAIIREVSRRLRNNDTMAIEDLRLKAKELADAYQQLAEEEFARNQFLTDVAQELRTPLTTANERLHAMRMGMIQGEDLKDALDTVWRSLQEITSLTNDILFLQEMELVLPEFRSTDLGQVVRAAADEERTLAKRMGVEIQLDIAADLQQISGDPKSLQRAIGAILDNAIKFSPDGGQVQVSVQPGPGEIRIIIQDHGVGIPPEAMPRIFQRFFHLEIICGRVFRGIGLGLSIAKHVIDQHHGCIEVTSELEKGSTFIVRLKTNPA